MAAYFSFPESGAPTPSAAAHGADQRRPQRQSSARSDTGVVSQELQVYCVAFSEVPDSLPGASSTFEYQLQSYSSLPTFRAAQCAVTRRGADFVLLRDKLRAFCPGASGDDDSAWSHTTPLLTRDLFVPPQVSSCLPFQTQCVSQTARAGV
jgi:hypothetical protein